MRNSAPTGSRGSVGFSGFTVCTKNLQRFVAAGYSSASPADGDHQSRTFSVKKARCGAVETGKALVRLRANPLDNSNAQQIAAVVLNRRYFSRKELHALLDGVKSSRSSSVDLPRKQHATP
jgi:hypothetical protein